MLNVRQAFIVKYFSSRTFDTAGSTLKKKSKQILTLTRQMRAEDRSNS